MMFQQFTHAGIVAAFVVCQILIFVHGSFSEAALLLAESLSKKDHRAVSEGAASYA